MGSAELVTHFGQDDFPRTDTGAGSASKSRSASRMNSSGGLEPGIDFAPRFRIEQMLGEGGMGKVYKAFAI